METYLQLGRVFSAELTLDRKTIIFTEECDYHFTEELNKQQALEFLAKLQALVGAME